MPEVDRLKERAEAAERYKPASIRLLLVAQTPPIERAPDPPRYFYFDTVGKHDDLFRGVVRAVLREEPERHNKSRQLSMLRDKGVFLIDLKVDPLDPRPLSDFVPSLLNRCAQLAPAAIILIKADVFDVAFDALKAANHPVVDARIPFPGSGRQAEFARMMAHALSTVTCAIADVGPR